MQKYIIFGGTGFIGSHLCNLLLNEDESQITLVSRNKLKKDFWLTIHKKFKNVQHFQCDLKNASQITQLLNKFNPNSIVYCAGENPSTIIKPDDLFIDNNIINVFNFLNCCTKYYKSLGFKEKQNFKILNVTTYEIYSNQVKSNGKQITPKTIYSATKASALHLFNAWFSTYNLPIVNAICANNYGENQSVDKLMPMTMNNLVNLKPIVLFNKGQCMRNWIHVDDTAKALSLILNNAEPGKHYSIGSDDYISNKDFVSAIIKAFSEITNNQSLDLNSLVNVTQSKNQLAYDHQCHYISMYNDFNWTPIISLEEGLTRTIQWYLKKN